MTVHSSRETRERDTTQGRARRRAVPGTALWLGLCALVAWRIVATTMLADRPSSVAGLLQGPDTGSATASRNPDVAPDGAAAARARALLKSEPLSSDAYTVLGLASERAGRADEAAGLMRIAAAWWPHDLVAQTWLLGRDLRLGDARSAMARLDAVARTHPETLDALTDALAPALGQPAVTAALVDRLATNPPWRTRFIDIAVRLWRTPDTLIDLIERLHTIAPGLQAAELRPFLAKLIVTGRVDKAYLVWLRSLPGDRLADLSYLYNGRFRYPVSGMPFDWILPVVPGAAAATSMEGSERILTVGFLGGRISLAPVVHELVLAPGAYRLTGRVRTDRLRSERGAQWRIACHDDPGKALTESEPFLGTSGWRGFAVAFMIPGTGCPAQTLSLEIDARTESERRASGVVAFSDLDIQPAEHEIAPPADADRP